MIFTPLDSSVMNAVDDFLPSTDTSGSIGQLGRSPTSIGSGCSAVSNNGVTNHPAIFNLRAGNAANSGCTLTLSDAYSGNNILPIANLGVGGAWSYWETQAIVLTDTYSVASAQYMIGFSDHQAAYHPSLGNEIGVRYDPASAGCTSGTDSTVDWVYEVIVAGAKTCYDSGVAMASNTWYHTRIYSSAAGTIQFQINGAHPASITTAHVRQGWSHRQNPGHEPDQRVQRYVQWHTGYVQSCLAFANHDNSAIGRDHRQAPGHYTQRHSVEQRAVPGVAIETGEQRHYGHISVAAAVAEWNRGSKAAAPRGGPYCLLLCRFAPSFPSAQQRFFRCGGDPSRTQLRNPADELHRNRFGEWEMDRPLSQLIAPELIFERRKERPRCGKQRIVFLESGEIQHRLSVQLVSGHSIPDAFHCLWNRSPNRGANLFELRPHRLGLRGNVLVNRLGNALFHTLILRFDLRFFLADIRLALHSLRRSLPHWQRAPLHRVVLHGTMSGTWTRSRPPKCRGANITLFARRTLLPISVAVSGRRVRGFRHAFSRRSRRG